MIRLLIATTNPNKLREIRTVLADAGLESGEGGLRVGPLASAAVDSVEADLQVGLSAGGGVEVISLSDFPPIDEPEETGQTFEENARLKALYYARHAAVLHVGPILTVAEDSGLVIDALDGEPGVRSARYLATDRSYPERFAEIYRVLAERSDRPRTARFVCAVAVVRGDRVVFETTGRVEGEISRTPSGTGGFGYDPIFYYPPYGRTLAEVSEAQKLAVAHRGQAFRAVAEWLKRTET
jgi:XTP/dITP diphosphohydrolase